jgi:hypothetical protein
MKFRKKPVVIEAIRWNGDNLLNMLEEGFGSGSYEGENNSLLIPTLEGQMIANVGDWIINGVKGEFYPCKSDIFEATYDRCPND